MAPTRLQPWLEAAVQLALVDHGRVKAGVDQWLQVTASQPFESGVVMFELSDSRHRLRAFLSKACAEKTAATLDWEWSSLRTTFVQSIEGVLRSTPRPFRREPELVLWVSQIVVYGAGGSPEQGNPSALSETSVSVFQRLCTMTPSERLATCPELSEARLCDAELRGGSGHIGAGGGHVWLWSDFVERTLVSDSAMGSTGTARSVAAAGLFASPIPRLMTISSPAVVVSQTFDRVDRCAPQRAATEALEAAAVAVSAAASSAASAAAAAAAPLPVDTSESASRSMGGAFPSLLAAGVASVEASTQPLDTSSGGSAKRGRPSVASVAIRDTSASAFEDAPWSGGRGCSTPSLAMIATPPHASSAPGLGAALGSRLSDQDGSGVQLDSGGKPRARAADDAAGRPRSAARGGGSQAQAVEENSGYAADVSEESVARRQGMRGDVSVAFDRPVPVAAAGGGPALLNLMPASQPGAAPEAAGPRPAANRGRDAAAGDAAAAAAAVSGSSCDDEALETPPDGSQAAGAAGSSGRRSLKRRRAGVSSPWALA